MGYSADVIRRAQQRLAELKTQKQAQTQARLHQVYQALPQVREMDRQLAKTMVQAVQAALTPEGAGAMEEARTRNLAIQEERKALIRTKFAPDYLDESPFCVHCGGLGYLGATMCTCLEALCTQEQQRSLSLLSCGLHRFQEFRLDYYPDRTDPATGFNPRQVMTKTFDMCRRYAEGFRTEAVSLLFSGNTGLGKTFLSACIASQITEKGFSVAYESAPHLFAKLERARFTEDPELRRQAEQETRCYTGSDLMIIDDLGTEMGGQFVTSALYALINDRILMGKPTIVSTNLTNEEIEKRYSPQILSRLRGSFVRLPFIGEDIRVLKARGL